MEEGELRHSFAQLLLYGVTLGFCVLPPKVIAPYKPPFSTMAFSTLVPVTAPCLTLGARSGYSPRTLLQPVWASCTLTAPFAKSWEVS